MKKLLALSLALLLAVPFTGCKSSEERKAEKQQKQVENKVKSLSPDEYLDFVVLENSEVVPAVNNIVAQLDKTSNTPTASTGKITITPGEGLVDFLNAIDSKAGAAYTAAFGWFKNLSMTVDAETNGTKLMSTFIGLGLNDTEIASVDLTIDTENDSLYMAVPGILNKTLLVKQDGMFAENPLISALPDSETTEKLLVKFSDIVLDGIEVKEKTETEKTIGDLTAKVNAVCFELDEKGVLDIAKNVVSAVIEDTDIKTYITEIAKGYYTEAGYTSAEDMITDAYEGLGNSLESLNSYQAEEGTEVVKFTVFTDSLHKLSGISVDTPDGAGEFIYLKNNGKYAMEAIIRDKKVFEGKGETKGGKMSGSFTVLDGAELVTLTLSDIDVEAYKKNMLSGKAVLSFSSKFAESLGIPAAIADAELVFEFMCETEKTSEFTVSLVYKEKNAAQITITGTEKTPDGITVPADAINILEDEKALLGVIKNVNYSGLISKLTEAGASPLINMLISMIP